MMKQERKEYNEKSTASSLCRITDNQIRYQQINLKFLTIYIKTGGAS